MGVMEPANRKSAVVSEIASPLRRWEAHELERMGPAIRAAKSSAEVRMKQRARLVDEAAKAVHGNDRDMLVRELQALDEEIAANPIPVEPRLLADDITPENLATKMTQNNGRMGVLTAEGDLFDIMSGRYPAGYHPDLRPVDGNVVPEVIRNKRNQRTNYRSDYLNSFLSFIRTSPVANCFPRCVGLR